MNRLAGAILLAAALVGGCAGPPAPRAGAQTSTPAGIAVAATPVAAAPSPVISATGAPVGSNVARTPTTPAVVPAVVPTVAAIITTPAPAPPSTSTTTVEVSIADYAYRPIAGKAPLVVRWINLDPVDHDITWSDGASPTLKLGNSFERRFDAPGVFLYRCSIHAGMPGRVTIE